jgi:hypothetical protein
LKAGTSFFDILSSERFQQFRRDKLGKASINSFSIDTLPSSDFLVNGVPCSHIFSRALECSAALCKTGSRTTTYSTLSSRRLRIEIQNDKIHTFLQESALADDPAHAAGEKRLRVDLLEASAGAATRGKSTL